MVGHRPRPHRPGRRAGRLRRQARRRSLYSGPGLADGHRRRRRASAACWSRRPTTTPTAATAAIEEAFAGPGRSTSAPALGDRRDRAHPRAIRYEAQATTRSAWSWRSWSPPSSARPSPGRAGASGATGPILRAIGVTTGAGDGVGRSLRSLGHQRPGRRRSAWSPPSSCRRSGPVGVGPTAEVDPGVQRRRHRAARSARWRVLVVVTLGGVRPAARAGAPSAWSLPCRRGRRPVDRSVALPPVATAGLHLARAARRVAASRSAPRSSASAPPRWSPSSPAGRSSRASTTCADTPARFGAPWDVSVGGALRATRPPSADAARTTRAARDRSTRPRSSPGTDMQIGGRDRLGPRLRPRSRAVADEAPSAARSPRAGRRPRRREIAVGALTLRDLGLAIGDTVDDRHRRRRGEASRWTIVGTAIDQRHLRGQPGRGRRRHARAHRARPPRRSSAAIRSIVSPAPGVDVDAFIATRSARGTTGAVQRAAAAGGRSATSAGSASCPTSWPWSSRCSRSRRSSTPSCSAVSRNRRVLGVLKGSASPGARWAGPSPATPRRTRSSRCVVAVPLGVIVGRGAGGSVAGVARVSPPSRCVPRARRSCCVDRRPLRRCCANLAAAYPAWRAAACPPPRAAASE